MITTRYHGERYPVKPNNSAANRAANRRVTIRLERDMLGMNLSDDDMAVDVE